MTTDSPRRTSRIASGTTGTGAQVDLSPSSGQSMKSRSFSTYRRARCAASSSWVLYQCTGSGASSALQTGISRLPRRESQPLSGVPSSHLEA